jgi:Ca2+-binding EF-hand superfamily protein
MVGSEELPTTFREKMRQRWSQISNAFSNIDMKRTGKLSRFDFEELNKRSGLRLTSSEIDQIVRVFDRNNDGKIDFREFSSVIGDLLKPTSQPKGFSLFGGDIAHKRYGKKMQACSHQSMDLEDKKPLIQVIFNHYF